MMLKMTCKIGSETKTTFARRRRAIILPAVFLFLFSIFPPAAQSRADDSQLEETDAQQASNAPVSELEKMVVTATKTEHVLGDVPIGTTVITREELERQNVHNLAEAMKLVPGLYQLGSGVKIYGLDTFHTSLLIDGQKQYKCPGRAPILDRYPIEMIERIEIKKGASAVMSGGETSGGVIHVITRSASEKPTFSASTGFGSNGKQVHQMGGGAKIDKFGYRFDFVNSTYNGENPDSDAYTYDDFWGSLEYEFTPQLKTVLKPSYYNQDDSDSSWKQRKYSVNSSTVWQPNDTSKLSVRGSVIRLLWIENDSAMNIYETEAYYNTLVGKRHLATIGYQYQGDFVDEFQTSVSDQYTNNLYTQDEIDLDPVTLLLGVRWVDHNWWGDDFFPQASILYNLSDNLKFRASAERGFRSARGPLVFEGIKFFQKKWMRSDPDLVPETSWSYQASLEYQIGDRVLITGAVFRNELEDAIQQTKTSETYNGNPVFLVTNVSKARTQGGEIDVIMNFTDSFSGKFGYYYLESENLETGKALTENPENMASVNLFYNNNTMGFSIDIGGRYVGEQYTDTANEEKLDSYFVADFKITKGITDSLTAFFEVSNAFDEEYVEDDDEMPGDEIFGGIRINF